MCKAKNATNEYFCYRILSIVEFYLISNQDIDYQCESNFPGRFAPFFILEEIPFTCENDASQIIHPTIAIGVHAPMRVMQVQAVNTGLVVCCLYWFGVLYWTGVLYVLDWYVVCAGLMCCMYWTGVLYVLDWCVVCTGLVCCMYWTGVLYVLDWCVVCNSHTHTASYIPVACFRTRGGGEISPKIVRMYTGV